MKADPPDKPLLHAQRGSGRLRNHPQPPDVEKSPPRHHLIRTPAKRAIGPSESGSRRVLPHADAKVGPGTPAIW